jgi:hypothetical protein
LREELQDATASFIHESEAANVHARFAPNECSMAMVHSRFPVILHHRLVEQAESHEDVMRIT